MSPYIKTFMGAQKLIVVNDKYLHKVKIVWGGIGIWLSNEDWRVEMMKNLREWFDENVITIRLDEKLY